MPISVLISIIASFIITYLTIPQIIHVAKEKKLFDEPNHRKLNKEVIPTLGGIGIFIGFTISSILSLQNQVLPEIRFLYAASVIMLFMGLKDDIMAIPARKKLLIQTGAAFILVVMGNYRISNLYELFAITKLSEWIGLPVSLLIFLFLINAINLIDGIDGLASGLTCLVAGFLGIWFFMTGHLNYAILCGSLCGSLIAFLRFNLWGGKNKIFMGDTGSLILGVFIAAMIVKFMNLNINAPANMHFAQAPLIALALLIVPVTDTLRVFILRLYHRQSPFTPDMNHIHHILIKSGMSHIQASSFLILYTMSFVLLSLSLQAYLPLTFNFTLVLVLSFLSVSFLSMRNRQAYRMRKAKMVVLKSHVKEEQSINPSIRLRGIDADLKKTSYNNQL